MIKLETLTALLLGIPVAGSILILVGSRLRWFYILTAVLSSLTIVLVTIFIAAQTDLSIANTISWTWISFGKTSINLVFDCSALTIPLLLIIASISFLVNLYSIGFFLWDTHLPRYFSTLSFFTASMIGLTLSGNLLQVFVFWELVGLSSYLLISFYRNKPQAASAGTKALIVNKVGDAGFIIAIMVLYSLGNGLEISTLSTIAISVETKTMIGIGLLLAAFSKSAQFPFHSWLPDAMEGPTPVSALIHSATMVAAGVFLLVRLQFLLTPELLQVVAIVGTATAILGGLNALRESDLKRLLAWSTISQLGLMMMVIGNSGFESAYVYLLSHAIFKAGLFLTAGILISGATSGSLEDISKANKSIILIAATAILCFSLMGLPLTIGFLSKEYLLTAFDSLIYLSLFFLINVLSVFYSARVISIVYPTTRENSQQSSKALLLTPLVVLSIASLWFIYSPSPLSANWIDTTFTLSHPSLVLTLLSASWVIALLAISFYAIKLKAIHKIGNRMPELRKDNYLQTLFAQPVLYLSSVAQQVDVKIIDKGIHGFVYLNLSIALLVKWMDQNLLDGLVRLGTGLVRGVGSIFRQFVSGKIQGYIWWTLVAMVIFYILLVK